MARIALVASSFLPRFGGVEEHVVNTASGLARRGHEVTVWAVDQGDEEVPDHVGAVRVRYLPCPLPARSLAASTTFVRAAPRAGAAWAAAIRSDRPELLHVHCFGPNGVFATAAGLLARRPLVVSTHGETFADAHGVYDSSALLRRSMRTALARAAAVTSCSAFAAADLARFGADPALVQLVPNGIDLDEVGGVPTAGLPRRFVLGIGRLVENKGFHLLLEAYARLDPGTRAEVGLVIGGDGPARADLQARAEALGVAGSVHLVGRLERPQVVGTMRVAEALVVPSLAEAFGIAILEGWRGGTPVLATAVGGPPEFVTHGVDGLLVDPLDTVRLAALLEGVLTDPKLARRLGEAGRARAAAFSWDRVVDNYERIYATVLG